jgi:hypothetical protein
MEIRENRVLRSRSKSVETSENAKWRIIKTFLADLPRSPDIYSSLAAQICVDSGINIWELD